MRHFPIRRRTACRRCNKNAIDGFLAVDGVSGVGVTACASRPAYPSLHEKLRGSPGRRSVHYVSFGQNPDYYAEWCNGKFHCKATQAIKVLVHQCRQEGDIDQLALGMENTCVVVKGSELGKSKAKWYLGEHYETLDRVLEKNHRGIVVRYPSSSPLLGNFNSGGRSLGDFLNLKAWDEYIMIRESSTLGWSCEASRSWAAYQMTRFVHWKHGERSMGSLKDGSGVTLLFTLQSKFDCSSGMG